MSNSARRSRIVAAAFVASMCIVAGCQYRYAVEISGVVRDAGSGMPIEGVKIVLNGTEAFPLPTGPEGRFSYEEELSDTQFDDKTWTLSFKKDGYRDESVEIGRISRPTSGAGPVRIVAVIYMRTSVVEKPSGP